MNDKGYEKFITAIKLLQNNKSNCYIGTMQTSTTCKINDLILDKDDLYIAEHLKTGYVKKESDTYVHVNSITAGDLVIVQKISEEKYVIVERLVEL